MGTSSKSSFCSMDIRTVAPDDFYDRVVVPFLHCASNNGIKFGAQIQISKSYSHTKLTIPSGGTVEFSHLYRQDSESFNNTGGIQIFSKNDSISFDQMENTLKEFITLGILPCNLVVQKGGCYVATAVYGSYDCPEVWTLRRYRDNTLAITWFGRTFIKLYYAVSPTLVKIFGNNSLFLSFSKWKLDKMVRSLTDSGIENTPYNDNH